MTGTYYVWPTRKGSEHLNSKLKESEVVNIRNSFKVDPSVSSRKKLAKKYKVSLSCINNICYRQTWTHI